MLSCRRNTSHRQQTTTTVQTHLLPNNTDRNRIKPNLTLEEGGYGIVSMTALVRTVS